MFRILFAMIWLIPACAQYGGSQGMVGLLLLSTNVAQVTLSGIALTESGGATFVAEGGPADTYTVVLNSQPTRDVNIALNADNEITINSAAAPATLRFTAANWSTPQTVTVMAIDDILQEGSQVEPIIHSASSLDTSYNGIAINRVEVRITDNDTAAVTITESVGATVVTESGGTDTYTAVLTTQPTANVVVAVTPDAQTLANGSSTAINLTFTAGACPATGNWCTAQTVTVAAVNDALAEGAHNGTITHTLTSTDGNYNAIAVNTVTVAITDNDTTTLVGGTILGVPTFSATPDISTLAGSATEGSADGTGSAAAFKKPRGIATDGVNLYVADSDNNTIRQIVIATGVVTTLAGTAGSNGSTDGTGAAARFKKPRGITTDGTNLYVADRDNHTIRQIVIATGVVTTLAGTAGPGGSADGTGIAARFNRPSGITTDGTNLYVADTNNDTIRQIVIATGVVTTLAGSSGSNGSADGVGAAARFDSPEFIATEGTGVFVADRSNGSIRKVVIATGAVSTLQSGFTDLRGITTDGTNLYVTDKNQLKKYNSLNPAGAVTILANTANTAGGTDGEALLVATLDKPRAICSDGVSLYFASRTNNSIRRYF